MRAWIFSDCHVDVGPAPLEFAERPEHDLVIIAGDICEHLEKGVRWIVEQGLNDVPVIVVPGNHEFYRNSRDRGLEKGLEEAAKHRNIHILHDEILDLNTVPLATPVRIIGSTLWTDYGLFGEAERWACIDAANRHMNDHKLIRVAADGYRRWSTKDAADEHTVSRAFIEAALESTPPWMRHVVVTHHAPSLESVTPDRMIDRISAAYASNLDHLVDRAGLWIHGHIHPAAPSYMIGNGRVISNPRGYVVRGQHRYWDPQLVIDLAADPATLELAA